MINGKIHSVPLNILSSVISGRYLKQLPSYGVYMNKIKLEFQESDASPGKTEVKQGKFVEFISPAKVFFKRNL